MLLAGRISPAIADGRYAHVSSVSLLLLFAISKSEQIREPHRLGVGQRQRR